MLISLYHVDIQARKGWYLKIITHLVNICNVNGWLLYRGHSEQLRLPKKNQHNLLQSMKGAAVYCLLERSPSEQSQEDQKSEHHPLHVQVKKNQWLLNVLLIFVMTEFITGPNLVTNVTDAGCVQC